MTSILEDVSVLTQVSEKTLKKFIPIINYAIGHAVHETECEHKAIAEIDLGIGVLNIKIEDDCLRYKFVPSDELESVLVKTVKNRVSPIVFKLENDLQDKIDRTYRELL